MNGKIYLIPNTLGDVPPLETMPLSVKKIIEDHNGEISLLNSHKLGGACVRIKLFII